MAPSRGFMGYSPNQYPHGAPTPLAKQNITKYPSPQSIIKQLKMKSNVINVMLFFNFTNNVNSMQLSNIMQFTN